MAGNGNGTGNEGRLLGLSRRIDLITTSIPTLGWPRTMPASLPASLSLCRPGLVCLINHSSPPLVTDSILTPFVSEQDRF
jgi:hypothetical protein